LLDEEKDHDDQHHRTKAAQSTMSVKDAAWHHEHKTLTISRTRQYPNLFSNVLGGGTFKVQASPVKEALYFLIRRSLLPAGNLRGKWQII
jgi:hypothetical protein